MRLLLHIGAHKTATTLLQRNLRANRRKLADQFIYLAYGRDIGKSVWMRYLLNHRFSTEEALIDFSAFVLKAEESQATTILISFEDFLGLTNLDQLGGLYSKARPRLKRFKGLVDTYIEGHNDLVLKPLIVLRRQDSFVESCYVQEVQRGRLIGSFDEFIQSIDLQNLSWRWLLDVIYEELGVEATYGVFDRMIEDGAKRYWSQYLEMLGLDLETQALEFDSEIVANPSLSRKGLDLCRAIRPNVTEVEWRQVFRPFVQKRYNRFTDSSGPFVGFSDNSRQRLLAMYAMENQELGF